MIDYTEIAESLKAISDEVKSNISILANASALIYSSMDRLNWCGFYLMENVLK